MNKHHKHMFMNGGIAIVSTVIAAVLGEKLLEKARAKGWLGASTHAGEDDMGSDNDPIIKCAKNLDG